MTYREFFSQLTGHEPYPFQERLAERLCDGNSLVLRAPTGAGKTWAAVGPFLYGIAEGSPLADRLIYALPLRSLATSLHRDVTEKMLALKDIFPSVETIAKERDYSGVVRYICLQIGGDNNDPFFEGDLVFTTIDQLLSSYLLHPVSLPPKLDNINAGALIALISSLMKSISLIRALL